MEAVNPSAVQDLEEKWGVLDGPGFAKAFAMSFYGDLPLELFKKWRRYGVGVHGSEEEFQETLRVIMELKALEASCVGARNLINYIKYEWTEDQHFILSGGFGEHYLDKLKRLWDEWYNNRPTRKILQGRRSTILAAT